MMRPDAARWLRPDAGRWIRPVHPDEQKYDPGQPRVPAGNPDGGQWTGGGGGSATGSGRFSDNLRSEIDALGLFQVAPREYGVDGVQLAGDPPVPDSGGSPPEPPPRIPQERPLTRQGRMEFIRAAVRWIGYVGRSSPAASVFFGAADQVDQINALTDMIRTANDPPRTLEELQNDVGRGRRGYDNHHIVERTGAERDGLSRIEIDDPSNLVSIPRVKHIEITRWYATQNDEFGGISPRDYLRDKTFKERQRVGLGQLIDRGVMKP